MSIESTLNWTGVWLRIARERAAEAYAARALYATDAVRALDGEFDAGLASIVAASFAIEAEQLRVLGSNVSPKAQPSSRPWARNWGDWLGQFLLEKRSIDSVTAEGLGKLVSLRHDSVHPIPTQRPLLPHPVGTNTSPEFVEYSADVAQQMLALAGVVIRAISI